MQVVMRLFALIVWLAVASILLQPAPPAPAASPATVPPLPADPIIGRSVPPIALPLFYSDHQGINAFSDMLFKDKVSLLNVFASWCAGCIIEHPVLHQFAESSGVPVYGIIWKDTPNAAMQWLHDKGQHYSAIGWDEHGKAMLGLGLAGVPQTYIIDACGRIAYVHRAPITQQALEQNILPVIQRLKQSPADVCKE